MFSNECTLSVHIFLIHIPPSYVHWKEIKKLFVTCYFSNITFLVKVTTFHLHSYLTGVLASVYFTESIQLNTLLYFLNVIIINFLLIVTFKLYFCTQASVVGQIVLYIVPIYKQTAHNMILMWFKSFVKTTDDGVE